MVNDEKRQLKTTDNINKVKNNLVQPQKLVNAKVIEGTVAQEDKNWNNILAVLLRVLRQHLKDNQCELIFVIKNNEIPNSSSINKLSGWQFLTLNDQSNQKFCVIFKNYHLTIQQLQTEQYLNELTYLCDLVQCCAQSQLQQITKNQIKILSVEQSPYSFNDIEVHFIVEEKNITRSNQQIKLDVLESEIQSSIKSGATTSVKIEIRKIVKIFVLSYDYYIKQFSRDWNNLMGKVDKRGIKNGQNWFGFATDLSSFADNEEWLSMNENNAKAWCVGILPARSNPNQTDDSLYENVLDKFTQKKIGRGIIVYRKPEQVEQLCDPIEDIETKLAYLCRVDIEHVKCPVNNNDVYVVSSITHIRPYRILLKEFKN